MTTLINPYPTPFDRLAAAEDDDVADGKAVIIVGDPSCVTVVVGPRERLNVLDAVALATIEAVTKRLREVTLVPVQKLL
jgi:hypothetical protein